MTWKNISRVFKKIHREKVVKKLSTRYPDKCQERTVSDGKRVNIITTYFY